MTFPEASQSMNEMMRTVVGAVRRVVVDDGPSDQFDRVLAVITLVGAAAALAWPKGRKLPGIATQGAYLGRRIWERRSWWIPN